MRSVQHHPHFTIHKNFSQTEWILLVSQFVIKKRHLSFHILFKKYEMINGINFREITIIGQSISVFMVLQIEVMHMGIDFKY